ncbi:MAG: pyruvate kinase [Rickettsiales bacterium]|nr:pyruvate kinase [Rickettsiales bacterium]
MKKAKIVATIGPASESTKVLKELSKAGVNVFRLNFSHGTHEEHGKKIDNIRKLGLPGAIMLDTKGPEIRTGEVRDKLFVKTGDKFTITINKGVYEDTGKISVNYKNFLKDVDVDDVISFDSGVMFAKAIKKTKTDIEFKVVNGQTNITTKRHINLFGKPVSLPTVTEQDWKDIDFGIEKKVDMIALSFVRSAEDVKEVRDYCIAKGHKHVKIISKIENYESTQNIDEIIEESDGIMVARGDLACEIPFSKVPAVQKKIIRLCNLYKKPVIVATQMLLSMTDNAQPTRAEVSDVANAIYDGADAVMTSDETTKGVNPVGCIEVMAKIVEDTEEEIYSCDCGCDCGDDCDCDDDCDCGCDCGCGSHEIGGCHCGCRDTEGILTILPKYTDFIDAIVVLSDKVEYTNSVACARYDLPILSFVSNQTIANNLHLVWNTTPFVIKASKNVESSISDVEKTLKKNYKDAIETYLLVFEMNGCLTVQIRDL